MWAYASHPMASPTRPSPLTRQTGRVQRRLGHWSACIHGVTMDKPPVVYLERAAAIRMMFHVAADKVLEVQRFQRSSGHTATSNTHDTKGRSTWKSLQSASDSGSSCSWNLPSYIFETTVQSNWSHEPLRFLYRVDQFVVS